MKCSLLVANFLWVSTLASVNAFVASRTRKRIRFGGASQTASSSSTTTTNDSFVTSYYNNDRGSISSSECDDTNIPPSLSILLRSLQQLPSGGTDIRGTFVDHVRVGNIASVAHSIGKSDTKGGGVLTPFAAYCFGYAFARMVKDEQPHDHDTTTTTIALGQDPRPHGTRLADAFSRGAESVEGVRVVYTGLATTPSMMEFCRSSLDCDGAAMVTASHLPVERNGFKFFTKLSGGLSKPRMAQLVENAKSCAVMLHDTGILPPTSGEGAVFCSEWVDWMPHYARTLREAILREVTSDLKDEEQSEVTLPLAGLRIVLNAGNGSGGFFYEVLRELGADVSASLHLIADGDFPAGVPNPEYAPMIEETRRACEEANADLGIMFDTDADRSGFIAPRRVAADGTCLQYEELNRNRLIALLAVVFAKSSPGCAVVTDSVTSEGLSAFLQDKLGLRHVRYLKGYANVISKAKEITTSGVANAEMAIETSGHCAMKENDYLDDGTYTAVKVIGLLSREAHSRSHGGEHRSLLDLISDLDEMPEEKELRMKVLDGSLQSTSAAFDFCALEIEQSCENGESSAMARWSLDRENLEGIRVRTGDGGYFMLRKSLHDPIVSLQIEGKSRDDVLSTVVQPLIGLFRSQPQIGTALDLSALESY